MKLGEWQTLTIDRETSVGLFLVDEHGNDVLLPTKWIPEDQEDDQINVFLYRDGEDRIIATTMKPRAVANQYAYLKVKSVNRVGAWLDWGIEKDLLVPYSEQYKEMESGYRYVVYVFVDPKSDRLIASSRVTQFFLRHTIKLEEQQEVECLAHKLSPIGMHVVVNNQYGGVIHHSDLHREVKIGEKFQAFVYQVREDGKIDLRLRKEGYDSVVKSTDPIIRKLQENEGFLPFHDKSSPDLIKKHFGMSKKSFKKIIGGLYRRRLIEIKPEGIYLIKE